MNGKELIRVKVMSRIALVIGLVAMVAGSVTAQEIDNLPLSETGSYAVGTQELTFIDESRDARDIDVTVWYPAVEDGSDAAPDLNGAPYPVIIYSHGRGSIAHRKELAPLISHLVSHGFVVAAPMHNWEEKGLTIVYRPLDVLFVIDQLIGLDDNNPAGMMNLDQLGVMGYSMGAITALQMAGVRPDREYLNAYCADHLDSLICLPESEIALADSANTQFATQDENGLWYVPTHRNIRAVAAMAPIFAPIFGERGLAAAHVPVLLMAPTQEEIGNYERDAVFMFNHLGSQDTYLISFIGDHHTFGYGADSANPRIEHFMTAYFGYYLQGREDYAQYLTEDFVNGIEGLAWGPYSPE